MARPPIIWTDEMLDELEKSYPIRPNHMLAERFQVSEGTLRRKAKELNLKKSTLYRTRYDTWTIVLNLHGKFTICEIARKARVSERTIYRICKRLNLSVDRNDRRKRLKESVNKAFRAERSRLTYGMATISNRRIGKSKGRQDIANLLIKSGYIVLKCSYTVYYGPDMQRNILYEEHAKAYGFRFVLWGS